MVLKNVAEKNQEESLELKNQFTQRQFLSELFFSNASFGLNLCRMDGTWLESNPAFLKMVGYSRSEADGGLTYWQLTPQKYNDQERVQLENLARFGCYGPYEKEFIRKDGSLIAVRLNGFIVEKNGEKFIWSIIEDLSKVRQIEDEERQLRIRYECLFNAVDQTAIVAITDKQGKINYVNDNFCKISGYSRSEILGKDHRVLNSGFHSKEFFKDMWSKIIRGETWQGEIRNRRKDGTYYWVNSTLAPFRTNNSGDQGYIAIRFDVTAEKESQQKMIQNSKMSSLGEMAGGIAHEINNPLAIISGKTRQLLRMMQNGSGDLEKLAEGLTMIDSTSERIARIIRGLRSFSRNADNDPLVLTPVSHLIEETLELCRERFSNHGVKLDAVSTADIWIECRPVQIVQILVNLLNNAHDAVEIHEQKWVTIETLKHDNKVQIIVTDSGNGISQEILDKIMDPFFTTKEVGKGTGLGLSISKGIAEQHHGQLWYQPRSGNTAFVLELPTKRADAAANNSKTKGANI